MQVASTTTEAIPRPTALPEARTELPCSDSSQVSLKPNNVWSDQYVALSNSTGDAAGYSDTRRSLLHCKTRGFTRHQRILTMLYRRSDITASIEENVYPIWSKVIARAMLPRH